MDASRDKAPSPQETFVQMAQAAGLRGRVLVTLGLLILARFGTFIPVPGIDRLKFAGDFKNNPAFGVLDIFSGGLSTLGIFALGIIPYINASIIIQLLTTALPALEKLQKEEGEAGRRKISQITRYVAVVWGFIQSIGFALYLNNQTDSNGVAKYLLPGHTPGIFFIISTAMALTAGAMFVMWISELITEKGIGNGASLLIFLNIVAVLPKSFADTFNLAQNDSSILTPTIALLAVFILMTVGIVFVQEGTRRIPIISARRQVGRRIQRERTSYLPLRLNQGGVMPIIFASSVLILPGALASFIATSGANSSVVQVVTSIKDFLSPNGNGYVPFYLILIVFFSYFYSSLVVNPVDMAQNLKKMGASIPGVRPGVATSKYIEGILTRLTLLGAIFLGVVATVPTAIEGALNVSTFKGFGATSLLILVSVAIDTAKQIQTLVISQRYEGMIGKD